MQYNLYTAYPLLIVVEIKYTDLGKFYTIMADYLLFPTVKFKYKETSEKFIKYRILNFLMKDCCRYLVYLKLFFIFEITRFRYVNSMKHIEKIVKNFINFFDASKSLW